MRPKVPNRLISACSNALAAVTVGALIVLVDQSADRNAGEVVQQREYRVTDMPADIFEIDVDAIEASCCTRELLGWHLSRSGKATIPGDFLGLRSILFRMSDLSLEALTEIKASEVFAPDIVSGYLFDSQRDLVGSVGPGSIHAWTEICVPGAGWITFDSTNRSVGSKNLIPVAVARDLRQIVLVTGKLHRQQRRAHGNGRQCRCHCEEFRIADPRAGALHNCLEGDHINRAGRWIRRRCIAPSSGTRMSLLSACMDPSGARPPCVTRISTAVPATHTLAEKPGQ